MIRPMTNEDFKFVSELEKEIFTDAWSLEDFNYELNDNPFAKLWVFEENDEIIGYLGIWIVFDRAELTTIGLKKEYRGKGLGEKLLLFAIEQAIKEECELMCLEVRISNEKAISLYEKHSFNKIAIKKNYYKDNHEDAHTMMKGLI